MDLPVAPALTAILPLSGVQAEHLRAILAFARQTPVPPQWITDIEAALVPCLEAHELTTNGGLDRITS